MEKEIFYRRSFHSDRDFHGMLDTFDFDRAPVGRTVQPDRISVNGFEAPRNSLDIPNDLQETKRIPKEILELRRKSEVRYEDIPIGYELSRSLTSNRRTEVPETSLDAEHKRRTPSVVARLMGLEAMPDVAIGGTQKIFRDKQSSKFSFGRHRKGLHLPQDSGELKLQGDLSAVQSQRDIPVHNYHADCDDERMPCGALSFREHPQERQLENFKKEFANRQVLQHKDRALKKESTTAGKKQGHIYEKVSANQLSPKLSDVPEKLIETTEFLDALDFLQKNKGFFLKLIRDPMFGGQVLQFGFPGQQSSRLDPNSGMKTSKTGNRSSRIKKQKFTEPFLQVLKQHEQKPQKSKVQSHWHSQQKLRFQPNEDMPIRNHSQNRNLLQGNNSRDAGQMPTRIVVLKPSPRKCVQSTNSSSSSPNTNVNPKDPREDGVECTKSNIQYTRERTRHGYQEYKRQPRLGKEVTRDNGKKDPREIAKEIVKKVKEDVTLKLSKDVCTPVDVTTSQNSSSSRRLAQQLAVYTGDMNGYSDGEGSCFPSRRLSRIQNKLHSSLPNSPRLDKIFEPNSYLGNEGKELVSPNIKSIHVHQTEGNKKSPRFKGNSDESERSCQCHSFTGFSLSKWNLESAIDGHTSCSKLSGLESGKTGKLLTERKAINCQEKTNNITDPGSINSPLRILPRSHSVPTVLTVRKKALGDQCNFPSGQKTVGSKENDAIPSKAKTINGSSSSKEKIIGLKDSFSQANRKTTKKMAPIIGDVPPDDCLDTREIIGSRQKISGQQQFKRAETTDCKSWVIEAKTQFSMLPGKGSQTNCTSVADKHFHVKSEVNSRSVAGRIVESSLISINPCKQSSITSAVGRVLDTSMEKSEQPSPVSVLETPFQEESPSTTDLQENDLSFDEFQLKLPCLQLDCAMPMPHYKGRFLGCQEISSLDQVVTKSQLGVFPSDKGSWVASEDVRQPSECFSVHDIACPDEREADLVYIRDILVLSGFTRNGTAAVKSFSSDHGLDPSIFTKLEQKYHKKNDLNLWSLNGKGKPSPLDALDRRLLFDIVDEIMIRKIGVQGNWYPWSRPCKPSNCVMRTGKQLLEQIWGRVNKYSFLYKEPHEDTLEDLAAKNLLEAGPLLHAPSDVETIGWNLEQKIFNALIEEAILDFSLCRLESNG